MTFTATCPSCGELLDVEEEHRGWTVRCPQCRHEFVAESGSRPRPEPSSLPIGSRRRRRRFYDEYDDGPDFEAARLKVASPGMFLEVIGWSGVVLSLAFGVLLFFVGFNQQEKAQNRNQNQNQNRNKNWNNQNPRDKDEEDAVVMMVMGGCIGVGGLPFSILMAIGGRKMRKLTSYNWAMTASILAIASIVLFGVCSVLHVGAGIWALTALTDRNVQASFKSGGRGRRRERDDNLFEDQYD